jgi:hypothetical protein
MLCAIGAFVFLVLLNIVGLLAMEHAPASYRAGVHSVVGVIGLVAVVWTLLGWSRSQALSRP